MKTCSEPTGWTGQEQRITGSTKEKLRRPGT